MDTTNALTMWDFTLSKAKCEDKDIIIDALKQLAKHWVFQEEIGEETGYEHFQGRFALMKKKRKSALLKLFKGLEFLEDISISPTSTAGGKTAFAYVMKLDTRVAGPWSDKDPPPRFIQDSIKAITELRSWQQKVVDISDEIDLRRINIIYDPIGNNGKSVIVKWMEAYGKCIKLPVTRDYKDIVQMALCIAEDRGREDPATKCWMIDMPRAIEKAQMSGFFGALETLKDGKLFDMRYKYREYIINEPVVWVFTNKVPDLLYLSKDRWRFWQITNDGLNNITEEIFNRPSADTKVSFMKPPNSRGNLVYELERLNRD
jgi:hypothetical protein